MKFQKLGLNLFTPIAMVLVLCDSVAAQSSSGGSNQALSASAAFALRQTGVQDLGPAGPNDQATFSVVLKFRNQAALSETINAITDRRSPMFGHALTDEQFASAFSPTAAAVQQVVTTLRLAGFQVNAIDPNRTVVKAQGSAIRAERFFGVRIHRVFVPGVGFRHLNLNEPVIPSSISPIVLAVFGLNEMLAIRRASSTFPGGPLSQLSRQRISLATYGPILGADGGLGPTPIAQAFNYPALSGYYGAGITVGIVVAENYNPTDVALYQQYFQVPYAPNVTVVPIDGGGVFNPNDGNSFEADQDVQAVYGLAPAAAIRLYTSPKSGATGITPAGEYDSINAAVNRGVNVISISYGGCELGDESWNNSIDQLASEASAKGITIAAASGDQGYGGCGGNYNQNQANFPASDTFVTAVGGLTSSSTNSFSNPIGWSGSGGYGSRYYPKPAYQSGLTLGTARVVPDISLIAFAPFVAIFFNGTANEGNGTSIATPLFAAGLAEVDQKTGVSYGFANKSLLYNAFRSFGYSNGSTTYFSDITSGNNGQPAQPGWDFVTGIGEPNFQGLETVPPACCE